MSILKKQVTTPKQAGKLIVIEGWEDTGTTTQIELLAQTLGSYDYDGLIFDFPQYSSASSELLQKFKDNKYGDLNPEAASILYALDRFDTSFALREHIADGKIILANRYVTSNAIHQGIKIKDRTDRIKFYKWLDHLEYNTFDIPKPDLTIILKPNPNGTSEQSFIEVAGLFPNTKLVECSENNSILTSQEIHAKIWELVRRIVLKNNSF